MHWNEFFWINCDVFGVTWMANMRDVGNVFPSLKRRHLNSLIQNGFRFAAPSRGAVSLSIVFAHDYIENSSFAAKDYEHVKWLQHIDDISHYPAIQIRNGCDDLILYSSEMMITNIVRKCQTYQYVLCSSAVDNFWMISVVQMNPIPRNNFTYKIHLR